MNGTVFSGTKRMGQVHSGDAGIPSPMVPAGAAAAAPGPGPARGDQAARRAK